jgi:hypothetical protein
VLVDIAGALAAAADKLRAIDPVMAAAFLPNDPANHVRSLLVAGAVLQAWRAPAIVSTVEIDALRGTVTRAENTTVRELENGRVIAWTQDDRVLPAAVDFMEPAIGLAVLASGFASRLDAQTLRIRGMAAEQYRVTIDGETVGTFHRDQLDTGLNLALLRTPMWRQAMDVLALTRRHNELRASRRQLLNAPVEQRRSAEWRAALQSLDAAEADLVSAQLRRARAGTHDYELQPVER